MMEPTKQRKPATTTSRLVDVTGKPTFSRDITAPRDVILR